MVNGAKKLRARGRRREVEPEQWRRERQEWGR
jgi:hypothetical protein